MAMKQPHDTDIERLQSQTDTALKEAGVAEAMEVYEKSEAIYVRLAPRGARTATVTTNSTGGRQPED